MRFGRTEPLPNQSKWDSAETESLPNRPKWDSAETEYSAKFLKGSAEYSAEPQNINNAAYEHLFFKIISILLSQIDSIILIIRFQPTSDAYVVTQLKSQTKAKVYQMKDMDFSDKQMTVFCRYSSKLL